MIRSIGGFNVDDKLLYAPGAAAAAYVYYTFVKHAPPDWTALLWPVAAALYVLTREGESVDLETAQKKLLDDVIPRQQAMGVLPQGVYRLLPEALVRHIVTPNLITPDKIPIGVGFFGDEEPKLFVMFMSARSGKLVGMTEDETGFKIDNVRLMEVFADASFPSLKQEAPKSENA